VGSKYISTDEISTVMFLADKLEKPILTERTSRRRQDRTRQVWASANGRKLIRLQCYEGLDESKALYEWETPSRCCIPSFLATIE